MLAATITAAVLATLANAHNSPHHPAMFGFDYPKQSEWPYGGESGANPPGCVWDSARAKWPIREDERRSESFWLSNGLRDYPPPAGVFLEVESGGSLTLDLNENRAYTRWRWPESRNPNAKWAGQTEGTLHTVNNFDQPANITLFGGTALAIAYTSDEKAVRGADLTVISTDWASPWLALASYPLPSGLPPCPPGGCLCTWNWLHTAGNERHNPNPGAGRPKGEGYGDELYNNLFRCLVTGASNPNNIVPKGAVPTQCDGEGETGGSRSNCTTGPKTPIIAWMADGNNVFPPKDKHARAKWRKPSYTWRYGFSDGAQQDAVVPRGQEATANGVGTVSDKPRPNPFEPGKGGLAVVNARGEALWPGALHAGTIVDLKRNGHAIGSANATAGGSVGDAKPSSGVKVQSNVAVDGAGSNSTAPGMSNVHIVGDEIITSAASVSAAAASSSTAHFGSAASPSGSVAAASASAVAASGSVAALSSSTTPLFASGPAASFATPAAVNTSASNSGSTPAASSLTVYVAGTNSITLSAYATASASPTGANTTGAAVSIDSNTLKPSGKTKCLRRRKRRLASH
ncbi:hypothetical protein CC85DRAFT_11841 [Cutaneotrichosporon oleaginosum]|uniref:Uncharacterized protein n=1 Tax=Cutaneotrichosporon oleaginosum TaxID=879819 RepID=A0A0J1AUE3_9TREE|nr:uncharacterized protein CC85DRAFT_11841 [Cutaneotrichosporon oleaginosum]KLT38889.1 hypothetical protein CC85DRAFT_11841 [Cutaneotrichosporon oleaginosum]TXT10370.1 hypothetical protein COLE_04304 [Cutaneotrichosporon oleaginosum]